MKRGWAGVNRGMSKDGWGWVEGGMGIKREMGN